jgi:filamentous hemagglutinin family protein
MKQLKRSKSALLIGATLLIAGHAAANPNGPTVTRGNATFSASGNTLTVTNTPGSIINWQDFSVGSQDTTRFVQPNSSSAVLNRVTGGNPSAILGQLQSNGKVFVTNPNGFLLGAGAQINTAAFMATTGHLSDSSFLSGGSSGGGSITILTTGGGSSGGGITISTAGGGSSGGSITVTRGDTKATISVAGGSTTSAPPAFAATRSVSAPATNASAVAGRHVAPISARPALFALEKREPLF